jgi:hypothetical protein
MLKGVCNYSNMSTLWCLVSSLFSM